MAEKKNRRAQLRIANPRVAGTGALAVSMLAILAFFTPLSSADYLGHVKTGSFEGAGTHEINFVRGMAVDNSAGPSHGDIYLTEPNTHRVQKFDPNGNFLLMFGDEVNETTGGDVCPVNPGDICKPGTNGGGTQQLGQPALIAVDGSNGPSKGDVYVTEFNSRTVRKYDENGILQTGWANGGVLTGVGSANEGPFSNPGGVAVDKDGNLAVLGGANGNGKVSKFKENGEPLFPAINSCLEGTNQGGLAVSPSGLTFYQVSTLRQINRFTGVPSECLLISQYSGNGKAQGTSAQAFTVDPVNGTIFTVASLGAFNNAGRVAEYILDGTGKFPLSPTGVPCPESSMVTTQPGEHGCVYTHTFGEEDTSNLRSVAVNGSTNTVYTSDRPEGAPQTRITIFSPLNVPKVTTEEPNSVAQSTATVTGHVDPDGAGTITECFFEFGPTTTYGNSTPCVPAAPINSQTDVQATLSNLSSGHIYHYRVVAVNALGRAAGSDFTLTTSAPPSINSFSSSDLTATTAILHATIIPNSLDTTYHFEYGTTTQYGTNVPIPDEDLGAGSEPVAVSELIENLVKATYHFRVVAENELGTTVSEDQTFNFFPPDCPNRTIRQATGSDYLPDCRAYELVSPGSAGNVLLTPNEEVPVSTYATDPARLAFMGSFGVLTGTEPPNGLDDLYTATRTPSGWHTSFIGKKGNEVQDNCFENANPQLSVFLVFRCEYFIFQGVEQPPTNLPFIFDSGGNPLGRWPVSWSLIPGADASKGALQPSPDFSHMAFSSNNVAFAPNGLDHAPGSAYDYNTETGSTKIISYAANGDPIGQEPGNVSVKGEFILFPGVVPTEFYAGKPRSGDTHPSVSRDGSHILMSTSSGPYEQFTPEPIKPVRLYMRVDDMLTYEVSNGKPVKYVGMTEDGSKVFFLSNEHLTADDHDTSADLYMWSEETDTVTRISAGESGTGDTDACTPTAKWTTQCSVKVPESELAPTDNFISEKRRHLLLLARASCRRRRRRRRAEPLPVARRRAEVRDRRKIDQDPDDPAGHPHGVHHGRPGDLLRQQQIQADVHLHAVHRNHPLRVLPDRRKSPDRQRRGKPQRALHHR